MISLVKMTTEDFSAFLEKLIPAYAAEKVTSGNWIASEALERSRLEFEHILPQGIDTPQNFVGKLLDETQVPIGYLWYARREEDPEAAFIFDFEIYEPFRRRGYASEALQLLEERARQEGIKRLVLHVFGHNTAARELYRKLGYIETNLYLRKDLS